jgi:hypothetical protein
MITAGIDFLITCTSRLKSEQIELYKKGREFKNGKWFVINPKECVTWTLDSKHLTGDAFDFVIMVNGKPDWKMIHKDLWNKAVEIGKSLGLKQAVNKKGKVLEFAHLQI